MRGFRFLLLLFLTRGASNRELASSQQSGSITSEFSDHSAVSSWNVITSDPLYSRVLNEKYLDSTRVAIKTLYPDFSSWGNANPPNKLSESGTFAEYETYITESMYFASKDPQPYHLINSGHARVDVGIVALPLLVRTGGRMIIPNFKGCVRSLLTFYDVESEENDLAILKPKSINEIRGIKEKEFKYDWCFSYSDDSKVVKLTAGPSDTENVMKQFSEYVGCKDFDSGFYCDNGQNGERVNCLSCYAGFVGVSKRGFWVRDGVERVLGGGKGEL